ncbi:MAG TPA: DUF2125 domain-containing protein [Acetobacteraceae bacterium]|nr:DUF2125 domain-containing protein [Acetobacteraceae bacterium]
MRRGFRWRSLGLSAFALLVLLAAGDAVYWRIVAGQLDSGFRAWIAAQRAAGWTVRGTPPRFGGWPLAATLTTTRISLSGGKLDFPGGMDWDAGRLVLRVALLHPEQLQAIPSGVQHLRLGTGPAIPFTAGTMQAVVPLQPDQPPRTVILHATDLRAGLAGGGSTFTIGRLQAQLDSQPSAAKPALGFAIQATSLALPGQYRWALGPSIEAVTLDGTLTGPFPATPDLTARATAWRDGGGALELRRLHLNWGPLSLTANARLGLDQQLQPAGHAEARVAGYDATLDALATAGALSPSAALAAKAVLSLMAQPAANGKPAEVDVPLRLQNGTLFMQTMPLVRLPVLDWPLP